MGPLALAAWLASASPAAASTRDDIDAALARVAALKMMEAGRDYALPARGQAFKGKKDDFLNRREPDEILASGVSSGCGDHASAFYGLMRGKGAELLLIDGVELSATSLLDRFDGHTGVAVKDAATGRWILVDPTNKKVVSEAWDPSAKVYSSPAGRFWIGYAGRLEDFPVRSPAQLKNFFRRTLRFVPAATWDQEVIGLEFGPGSSKNPRTAAFIERYSHVYDDLGVQPKRHARILFSDGGEGSQGGCQRTGSDSWECLVGRGAAMNERWFSRIERYVSRQFEQPFSK